MMRNQDYGVVAIPGNYNSWPLKYRESAEELMAEHFPAGYVIDHEEEYVVGQTTRQRSNLIRFLVKPTNFLL